MSIAAEPESVAEQLAALQAQVSAAAARRKAASVRANAAKSPQIQDRRALVKSLGERHAWNRAHRSNNLDGVIQLVRADLQGLTGRSWGATTVRSDLIAILGLPPRRR